MISRRQFLAAAAADAVLANNRITVACIGTGWQGMNNVQSFLAEPGAQVVAVCDIDADHLEEGRAAVNAKYGNSDCKTYHDFEDIFARPDIDAVALTVPDHWHGIAAIRAIQSGKDVYGEKPIAHNFEEGRAVRDAVARYGRVWQTGSWQRSLAQFRRACELVRNGRLGQVTRVEVGLPGGYNDFEGTASQDTPCAPPKTLDYERWLGPAPWAPYCPARVHKNWRYVLDYGGGLLMDWIGHHADIAHWGLGLDETGPMEVTATGEFTRESRVWNAPGNYRVTARYSGGVTIIIDGGDEGIRRGTKWIGSEGWLWVDRAGMDAHPRSLVSAKIRPDEFHLPESPGHHRQFLDCVRTRARTLTPPDVALRSATPGYLGLISILTGRTIRWDPVKEQILDDPSAARLLRRPMRGPWRI